MAATPANIPHLNEWETPPDVPDFRAGDPIGTHHDWNLGPTGARGWMWGWSLSTDLARQIYVTQVAAGSPAAQNGGLLKVTYTPCFSSDLVTFYDNNHTANPVVVAASSTVSADYEVVKVPYPASLPNGQRARFANVRLAVVP